MKVEKVEKLNIIVISNIVGSMKSIIDKKKGGHIQGFLTLKDKEIKGSRFEVGKDQHF